MSLIGTAFFFLLIHASSGSPAYGSSNLPSSQCGDDQLKLCADNAEPVLRGSEFTVPDSPRAVSQVCGVWTELTNCIGNYTRRCLNPSKRAEFVQNTNDPISSMSSFCRNPDLQNDYLKQAPCVKRISTQDNYCGKQYKFFFDLVADGTLKQVCCAKAKFMNCFMEKTPNGCENRRAEAGKDSTRLAVAMLDSSLAFMSHRCSASRFKESDCPGIDGASGSRESSKGPLLNNPNPGQIAAVGSQFQLDQGHKQQGGWIKPDENGGLLPVAVRPTTSNKEIKARPVADQFSGNQQKQQRPQTRPGPGAEGGARSLRHDHILLLFLFVLGISMHRFFN